MMFYTFLLLLLLHLGFCRAQHATYIVHMEKDQMPSNFEQHSLWYESSLRTVRESAEVLYTYSNAIHGFACRLTPEEVESLLSQHGVISILPEREYRLHTTRTPLFLCLEPLEVQNTALFPGESDIVIGVLDTGVWPESKSYSDDGYGPIPSTWKGTCEAGTNYPSTLCNRKLVGARFFDRGYEEKYGPIDESKESKSPRDNYGHGTHTSSTAA
ncbi:unnamed protein product [Eruca vesicaria subsp. sativa]|uniref:Inhibitor I9 domain-containing protein n=1 Tax=Eruca vesicaria subsp. sativa TaxID=29727 RepID=A0ABC8KLF0_ERUVS|nr:unnamed protein product [Eruca vesicaria subsp. sativa]